MFTVYVLKSESTEKIYIGQTIDIEKRLAQHNDLSFDKRSYTKLNGTNWILIYKEEYTYRKEAIKREKELKSHKGRDWLRKMIMGR